LHQACSLLGAVSRRSATVVQLDLRQPETLRWMTGRGEIRRKRQRLGRAGDLHLTCADTPERLTARLPAFIRLHSQQWRDRPHAVAPFDGGVVDRTFAAVAAEASSGAQLHELWLDDTLLAGYFGFLSGRTYFAYRTAYESRYRRDSPGHLLVSAMVEQLVAQGADTFDLMRGAYTYKLDLPGYVAHTVTAELA
jgi:CelD/BcsL family acetyltransferase involved in cellulose biosynthesis